MTDAPKVCYRLSFETVKMTEMWRYSNADPFLYENTTQTVPNSRIPDEHWHLVSRETGDPWDQYRQLRAWADADEQFVRNVRLEQRVAAPVWVPVDVDAPVVDGGAREATP